MILKRGGQPYIQLDSADHFLNISIKNTLFFVRNKILYNKEFLSFKMQ